MTESEDLPQTNTEDRVHTATKAMLSAIPVLGGPLATLLEHVWIPSLHRRREDWMRKLGQALERLQAKGFDVETLKDDEMFISVVTEATHLAIKTHQEEKLDALRNAVANTALGRRPEEDLTFILLQLVDTLTPSHIAVLWYFADPSSWFATSGLEKPAVSMGGSRIKGLCAAFPSLDEAFLEILVHDLVRPGLLPDPGLRTMVTGPAVFDTIMASLGQQFLDFVTEPT